MPGVFPDPNATLTSITMYFWTSDFNKDPSMAIDTQITNNAGATPVAKLDRFGDGENFTTGSEVVFDIPLQIQGLKFSDLHQPQYSIRVEPQGNDPWSFQVYMSMNFSDGVKFGWRWEGQLGADIPYSGNVRMNLG
jgi:hypothetical protein